MSVSNALPDRLEEVALEDTRAVQHIGRYRLVRKLGQGGMGVVYLAEQMEPVRRQVALKIVRHGMDTEHVVARFESERQTLALMKHPHIACILDAGSTEAGLPYFVMEYVDGEPIIDYCDRKRLSVDARLRLFVQVCLAVQHAHQKGIIHRDLKPTNILVAEQDGEPVPKIIDFGIAKAIRRPVDEQTLSTKLGHLLGTPEYMSPEQAGSSTLAVDTRSDVYSLGVVLYELLVGVVPIDFRAEPTYYAIQVLLREGVVEVPSRRLDGTWALRVAHLRSSTPRSLVRTVRGDLDSVVMTALAKDPAGRYAAAQLLADDVQRHLRHETVRVGLPSLRTRARKLIRRRRGFLVAVAVVLLAVLGGCAAASLALLEVRSERDAARKAQEDSEAVTDFMARMLAAADPAVGHKDVKVREVLDQASASIGEEFRRRPRLEARLRQTIGATYDGLGLYEEAERHVVEAARLLRREYPAGHPRRLEVQQSLARIYRHQGRLKLAEDLNVNLLQHRHAVASDQRIVIGAIHELALVYAARGQDEEAMALQMDAVETSMRLFGDDDVQTLRSMHDLATQFANHGRYDEAEALRGRLLEGSRRTLGEHHPLTIAALRGLGCLNKTLQRYEQARSHYQDSLAASRQTMGAEHPVTLGIATRYAELLEREGELKAAENLLRHTVDGYARVLGPRHVDAIRAVNGLGRVLRRRGELEASETFLRRAVEAGAGILDPESEILASYRVDYAVYLTEVGRIAEAEMLLQEAGRALERSTSVDVSTMGAYRSATTAVAAARGISPDPK